MTRAALRLPTVLLTLGLFAATGVGVPVHHHADHDGDRAHLTAEDHGHGTALLTRDMRTERRGTSVQVAAALPLSTWSHPTEPTERARPIRPPVLPTDRAPPPQLLPRGPPSTS